MKFMELIKRIFTVEKKTPASPGDEMQANKSEMMQKVLTMLSNTQEVELSCDEVFALLDQFTELAAQGEDVAQLMPLVQHHLDMCDDCREEYRVLESILHGTA